MATLSAPEAPSNGHAPLPSAPPPQGPRRTGLFGWIARNPKRAFWSVLVASLLVGMGIGGAATSDQEALDASQARSTQLRAQLDRADARIDALGADVSRLEGERADVQAELKAATARGEVPDFTGQDVADARDEEAVTRYDWRVKTTSQVSDRAPGTVLAQRPAEGESLKAGRSITLIVAKKAPPKPRQWVSLFTTSGSGQKRTDEFSIPEGVKARVKYSYAGDFNDTLFLKTTDEGSDDFGDMLVNEIGPHSGESRLYGKGGEQYYLEVDGESWTVEVQVFKRPE